VTISDSRLIALSAPSGTTMKRVERVRAVAGGDERVEEATAARAGGRAESGENLAAVSLDLLLDDRGAGSTLTEMSSA